MGADHHHGDNTGSATALIIIATAAACFIGSGWVTAHRYLPSHDYLVVGLAIVGVGVLLRLPAAARLLRALPCGPEAVKHAAVVAAGICMVLFVFPVLISVLGRVGTWVAISVPPATLIALSWVNGPVDWGADFLTQTWNRPAMVPYWSIFVAMTAVPLACFAGSSIRSLVSRMRQGEPLVGPAAAASGSCLGFVWGLVTPTRWVLLATAHHRAATDVLQGGKWAALLGAAGLVAALVAPPSGGPSKVGTKPAISGTCGTGWTGKYLSS